MAFTTGLSKEGKKIFNSSTDSNNMKQLLSEEDFKKLEENIKKEAMKAEKQIAKFIIFFIIKKIN